MCIKCGNPDLVHDFGVTIETSDPFPSADSFSEASGSSSCGKVVTVETSDPFPSADSFSAASGSASGSSGLASAVAQPAPGPSFIEVADAAANAATAYTIGVGQTAQGTIAAPIAALGDHDWYRVNLVAGQTYSFAEIGTGTHALQDTFLYLHDASGN